MPAIWSAYRLNWNPQDRPNDLTEKQVQQVERLGAVEMYWRCGNTRMKKGDRVYLIRTGTGARGLVGAGTVVEDPEPAERDRAVLIRLTTLSVLPLIERSVLDAPPFNVINWSAFAAAIGVPDSVADEIDQRIDRARDGQIVRGRNHNPQARQSGLRQAHSSPQPYEGSQAKAISTALENNRMITFQVERSPATATSLRREAGLLRLYLEHLAGLGCVVKGRTIMKGKQYLRVDAFNETRNELIEGKADDSRESIRTAIGQLYDYRRAFAPETRLMLLLPRRPERDLEELLASAGIRCTWPNGSTFEESTLPVAQVPIAPHASR